MGVNVIGVANVVQHEGPVAFAVCSHEWRRTAEVQRKLQEIRDRFPPDEVEARAASFIEALKEADRRLEAHWAVEDLWGLPEDISYPEVALQAATLFFLVQEKTGSPPRVYVDATGTGDLLIGMLRERKVPPYWLTPVYFTHGDRRLARENGEVRLGKAYLVARLQGLLQDERLHLPTNEDAALVERELLAYKVKVDPGANEREGAFRVGSRDDLVTALGLAVQVDMPPAASVLGVERVSPFERTPNVLPMA